MKDNEKKGIILLVIIAIVIILIIVKVTGKKEEDIAKENTSNVPAQGNAEKYVENLENGVKINKSEEFNKTKKYKNMEISNIQFTYEEGRSVLLADVKNTASVKHNNEIVKITILDENNKVIEVLEPVLPTIEPGETKQLNVIISGADSVNAKDFKIEAK